MNIELCPETGICTIVKDDGTKLDLMPCELSDVQLASGPDAVREAVGEADARFARALTAEELDELKVRVKGLDGHGCG